ncbi:MAG: FAD-dependent oxidoreductase [Bacteroidota bacterium]
MSQPVHVLGGGLAGLATAYYAQRHGREAVVYEAAPEVGGNARTLRFEDVLVDTGAHRLHDKDPRATAAFHDLLCDAMRRVEAPSEIRYQGRGIAFPLRPLNAARRLGVGTLLRVAAEVAPRLLRPPREPSTFRDLALDRYGPTLAHAFLLGYSEKLWGMPAEQLDPSVAGGRLRGLTLGTFLRELGSARTATAHLDGAFYYPSRGFGMLADALAEAIGPRQIRTRTPVTGIEHDGRRVLAVRAGDVRVPTEAETVSTLPLPLLVHLLRPAPPASVRRAAESLRYRHVRLAVLRLSTAQVSPHASLYVPDPAVPFTRLYEPKNRSPEMAPPDRTALVVEVPCGEADALWSLPDEAFAARLLPDVRRVVGPALGDVLSTHSVRLPNAYPVLEVGHGKAVSSLRAYAAGFENLTLAGRAGTFRYLHTHDLFAEAAAWAASQGSVHRDIPHAPRSRERPFEVHSHRST